MKGLIIYDSVWGNTEKVALTMGAALLAGKAQVQTLRAADVKPEHLAGLDFIIAGSPTQKFTALPAIKKLLDGLPAGSLAGLRAAAFDTRIDVDDINSSVGRFFVGKFGYAAKPLLDRLVKKGAKATLPPEGFFVTGSEGPLKEGEPERAAAWAVRVLQ
ncbi:MAG: flavodoxin family protein [Anaerolineae bacterium]|nr:flavodoxin family protein [Anaerolineae bacterium]